MKKRFTEAQMVDFLLTRWANRRRTPIFESFNRGLRDECLNEHWFTSLAHAQVLIESGGVRTTRTTAKNQLLGTTRDRQSVPFHISATIRRMNGLTTTCGR
jgi:putative transposase